jgi:hypothetical protein
MAEMRTIAALGRVNNEGNENAAPGRTVVIVAPPWPRGGTARVVQTQVEFYRERGYRTVLICVPLHCAWTDAHPGRKDLESALEEIGADQMLLASIDRNQFTRSKYLVWLRSGFRATALDWTVFTAASARIPGQSLRALQTANVTMIHVNHVFTLGFATKLHRQVARGDRSIPVIVETHDVQAHALVERREINPWTHRFDTTDRLVKSEVEHLKKIKVLIHLSEDDFSFFQQRLPKQQHILALPTIDESFVAAVRTASNAQSDAIDLLFVGQSTGVNCVAIQWFFERVWPLIAEHGYQVKIVGQIDALVRETLPDLHQAFNSCFVGTVSDLTPYYSAARCIFAPMVSGTGISIKTVEALALGKAFVGTSKAYRGMPMERIRRSGLHAYDTPEAFAGAIVRALTDGRPFAEAGSKAYLDLFSRKACFAARDKAIESARVSKDTQSK